MLRKLGFAVLFLTVVAASTARHTLADDDEVGGMDDGDMGGWDSGGLIDPGIDDFWGLEGSYDPGYQDDFPSYLGDSINDGGSAPASNVSGYPPQQYLLPANRLPPQGSTGTTTSTRTPPANLLPGFPAGGHTTSNDFARIGIGRPPVNLLPKKTIPSHGDISDYGMHEPICRPTDEPIEPATEHAEPRFQRSVVSVGLAPRGEPAEPEVEQSESRFRGDVVSAPSAAPTGTPGDAAADAPSVEWSGYVVVYYLNPRTNQAETFGHYLVTLYDDGTDSDGGLKGAIDELVNYYHIPRSKTWCVDEGAGPGRSSWTQSRPNANTGSP